MMNYQMQPTGDWAPTPSVTQPGTESGYAHPTYEVVETGTRQVIKSDMRKEEAKALTRHCNMGGFFDGFTPAFFLQSIPRCLSDDSSESD